MVRRGVFVICAATVLSVGGMSPAHATYQSTLVGTTATITGDGATTDVLTVGKAGGNLTLNGSLDWDSTAAGDQTLADSAATRVVVNAGDGADLITVTAPANEFASTVEVNGQGGADVLDLLVDSGDADSVWLTGDRLDLSATGHVQWDSAMDRVDVRTGNGFDVINVDASPTSPTVVVFGESGADYMEFADGAGLGSVGGRFEGGPGEDTVDYYAYTTPVSVELGQHLQGGPPGSGGPATGMPGGIDTVENVFSGGADDTLVGGPTRNIFECGGGHDSVFAEVGDRLMSCEVLLGGATVTGVSPASPGSDTTPHVMGDTVPPGADVEVRIYDNPSCAGPVAASGTAAQFGSSGIAVSVAAGSSTTLYATTADPSTELPQDPGAESVCSSSSVAYQALAPPSPPAPVGSVSPLRPKVRGKGPSARIGTGAGAACPLGAAGDCTADAVAEASIRGTVTTLATERLVVAPGQSARIRLGLSRKSRAAWRRAGRLEVSVRVTLTVPGGSPVGVSRTVTLRPPR